MASSASSPLQLVFILCLALCLGSPVSAKAPRVVVAGATGYIGRSVVKELVSRGIPTTALVRGSSTITQLTQSYLQGADVVPCNVQDPTVCVELFNRLQPSSVVCCLASRSGIKKDAYAVDYGCGSNLLTALGDGGHYVLLSAFCVQKPLLQLQQAKLKLEAEIRSNSPRVTHSIVRPTAYMKSLDGQIEQARKGNPIMYFGAGTCAANAIEEGELAQFLADCALRPKEVGMLDSTRNIGGPDSPPVTKLEQIDMIFDALGTPPEKRKKMSIPVGIFDVLLSCFNAVKGVAESLGATDFAEKVEDGAEIVRIVRYYATEPMVAVNAEAGEIYGVYTTKDHFAKVASRGGKLLETDEYTTTAGVLNLVVNSKYVESERASV